MSDTMYHARLYRAFLIAFLSITGWLLSPTTVMALSLDVSVGEGGIVVLTGTGWSNEATVTITAGGKKVTTVEPDNDGNFKKSVKSKTVKVGTAVKADDGAGDVKTAKAVDDPKEQAWSSGVGTGQFLTNYIFNTELLAAGFEGTITLVNVSSNAQFSAGSSPTTVFPFAGSDILRTEGYYDLLALGPVFGTYNAEGTFSNLFEEDDGLISGVQSITFEEHIGNVISEPDSLTLLAIAIAGLAAMHLRRVAASGTP